MFAENLVKCLVAVALIVIQQKAACCAVLTILNRSSSISAYNDEYVTTTISDNDNLLDSEVLRGNPQQKQQQIIEFDDVEVIDDEVLPSPDIYELPECILERSEFYLSWWVNDDGTLKVSASARLGNYAGFLDLSVGYQSEDVIFEHVSQMLASHPDDVISICCL